MFYFHDLRCNLLYRDLVQSGREGVDVSTGPSARGLSRPRLPFTGASLDDWISRVNRFELEIQWFHLAHENHWTNCRVDTEFVIPLHGLIALPDVNMAAVFASSMKVVRFLNCPIGIQDWGRCVYPGKLLARRAAQQAYPHVPWDNEKINSWICFLP